MANVKYKSSKRQSAARSSKRWFWFALGCVVVVAGAVSVLELTNVTHFFHKSIPASKIIVKAGNPVSTPVNNSSVGSSTAKAPATGNGNNISGGVDTGGSSTTSTNPNQWVVSDSGDITVKQPTANGQFKSGDVLSGSAKVSQINFRLIDSQVGVISEGTLNVVNGNFSGTINFTAKASTGRLDVFSTNAQGVELNEVQISVTF